MSAKQIAWVMSFALFEILASSRSAPAQVKLDTSPMMTGSVQADYEISPDGGWVVYRARNDAMEGMNELYCVPTSGGQRIKLNGVLKSGGNVSSWQFSGAGNRAIYWANPQGDRVNDVFGTQLGSGISLKLSPTLVDAGSTQGVVADRYAVYVASERTNAFFEPYFELFSTPIEGGDVVHLSGPLVAGGDVLSVYARPNNEHIVYLADQDADGVVELFGVAANTGSAVKLNPPLVTNGNVLSDGLQMSPAGDRVLYAADQEQDAVVELFSVPALGGMSVKLNGPLVNGGDVTPGSQQFSPDGTRVLYRADQFADEVFELFSVASIGGTPVRLNGPLVANGDVLQQGLQFGPNGSRVLYRADQNTDDVVELFSVSSLGGVPVRLNGDLVAGGDVVDGATFSPDGGQVLYRADEETDETIELYVVPSTGGIPTRLNGTLVAGGDVTAAAFSPDGSEIVYLADQDVDDVFELFAVPSSGGDATKISGPMTGGGDVVDWRFSPDGQTVVYRADQEVDGKFELFAATLDDNLPGDFNRNGVVDAADYTVWRDGLEQGTYRLDQYGIWKTNFGRTKSGNAGSEAIPRPVPEPASWALLATLLASIRRCRRRERIAG
jgi:Tol biopolymer transport system component